jgi:hypothetical protein
MNNETNISLRELEKSKPTSSTTICVNFALSGVTVLLSLTVFQQSISDAMPVTSLQIPLLGNCLVSQIGSPTQTTGPKLLLKTTMADSTTS